MKAPVSLTSTELLAVLAKARERRLRDWVMFLITYWHGLRASEAINLRARDFQGGELTVRRLKQRKRSMVTSQALQSHENPVLDELTAISDWLAEGKKRGRKGGRKAMSPRALKMSQNTILGHFAPEELLFPITRRQFARLFRGYGRECGLPARKLHPHCLKHTIGSDLVEAGMPLPKVQVHLGHKSISSTGVYTLPKEEAVSEAVGRAIRGKAEFRQMQQGRLFTEK